jgi:subtilisin family serine protease
MNLHGIIARRGGSALWCLLVAAACSGRESQGPVSGRPGGPAPFHPAPASIAIPDEYIVILDDTVSDVASVAKSLAGTLGGVVSDTYDLVPKGFAVQLHHGLDSLLNDRRVQFVEGDARATLAGHANMVTATNDVILQVFFSPEIDVSVCSGGPPNLITVSVGPPDANGDFSATIAPAIVMIGHVTDRSFGANLTCNGSSSPFGTMSAVWTDNQFFDGTYHVTSASTSQSGAVFVTRWLPVQQHAPWGLDRIDQRDRPLDSTYAYTGTGVGGVTVYIIDTGILTGAPEFEGRAVVGVDFVDRAQNGQDCNGHGTAVASVVGGATYGVAKDVTLVAVRIGDCQGEYDYHEVLGAFNWVRRNRVSGPKVVNASFGIAPPGDWGHAISLEVGMAIAEGVTVVAAAGNGTLTAKGWDEIGINGCYLPGGVPGVITVSATDTGDSRAYLANFGPCVTLFAPGDSIPAVGIDVTPAYWSGTSMAAPHVAGAAALLLEDAPTASPGQVRDSLVFEATRGRITDKNPLGGAPNLLLFAGLGGILQVFFSPELDVSVCSGGPPNLITVSVGPPDANGDFSATIAPAVVMVGQVTDTSFAANLTCSGSAFGISMKALWTDNQFFSGTYNVTSASPSQSGAVFVTRWRPVPP